MRSGQIWSTKIGQIRPNNVVLAKFGLAKCGQIRLAKSGLAKFGRDGFQALISSREFDSSICDWKNEFSLFGKYHLFRIESFQVDFQCVRCLQLLKVCNQYVTLPNSSRVQSVSEEQYGFLTGLSQL